VADGQQGCHHGDFAGDVIAVSHANGYRGGAHGKGGGLDLSKWLICHCNCTALSYVC
jgi:hypothetical protein